MIPLGKANVVLEANKKNVENGDSMCVITYGMGVYWALAAEKKHKGKVEIVDLRTLYPCDEETVMATVKKHNKCLVLTEETLNNSFAQALAGRISEECFQVLDAPVRTFGTANIPAIPLNKELEKEILPNGDKVAQIMEDILSF